jgi:UDP-N-acetylmuramoyl-tripeptide--D-alanyl-D-alanine ligase
MKDWSAELVARASGARLVVGRRGERADGGAHAPQALEAGAWGVLVSPEHARAAAERAGEAVVLEHEAPLAAMQALARAWRRALGGGDAKVIAVTGSTGKTSTKDILVALLGRERRTRSSPENFNTEVGLPLAVLAAAADTEVLVLEMAMRGAGQIAELTAIAEPDVGVIVNVGPAHLELLGSLEAIAAAKAELIDGLAASSTAVVPAHEPLLAPHLRADVRTITFGDGGDVRLLERLANGEVVIAGGGREIVLEPSFGSGHRLPAHQLQNLLAAVAAAAAIGIEPTGGLEVELSAMRGQRVELPGGAVVINDCYNANPMSVRAAIDELAEVARARRVAVLGDMLELGASSPELHREIGRHAAQRGVDVLVTVGPLAAHIGETFTGEAHAVPDADAAAATVAALVRADDTVLVKGSRGVALERVAQALTREHEPDTTPAGGHVR